MGAIRLIAEGSCFFENPFGKIFSFVFIDDQVGIWYNRDKDLTGEAVMLTKADIHPLLQPIGITSSNTVPVLPLCALGEAVGDAET